MTVQNKRSAKSKARSNSRGAGADDNGTDIGWGLGAESDDENLFMRRVLFAIIVAVLGCMGAWFMVTTVSAGNTSRSMLNSKGAASAHTVVLLSFPNGPSEKRAAELLAKKPEIRALAGAHAVRVVNLPTGECALCVGHLDKGSAELARLQSEFARYAMPNGTRPFAQAEIMSIAR